jgi:hypothetical protein
LPALESGQHGFFAGWLRTTRDALLSPTRFYGALRPGVLGLPFVFAALSLALPLIAVDLGGYFASGDHEAANTGALALVRSSLSPLFAAALLIGVQALLWTAVTRLLGAKTPLNLALRAMAYLTSIASSFGLVMTLSGFAPESGPYVVTWYLSMVGAYLFATYATYRLARGPYGFGMLRAGLTVWIFQLACAIAVFIGLAVYALFAGTATGELRIETHQNIEVLEPAEPAETP